MDDNYQIYLNRVARMTLPEAYKSQIQHIQESTKFAPTPEGIRQAASFPGYTIITPPREEDSHNSVFYKQLQDYQQQLLQLSIPNNLIVPLPPESFHFTLADLIWESNFLDACQQIPDYDEKLQSCFRDIFQQYQQSISSELPIRWQMFGLMVMPRALAVCLVPQDESSYERIISLRRLIYQNPQLMALGIEQQYYFTAHVTLGYFGEIPTDLDRDNFSNMLSQLNEKWIFDSPEIIIKRAELRKFSDMTQYYHQPDWPSLDF
ncbi:DUF1868 domain-containing protein [Calothrix rhizosoleniae]|uniref:DUF1868 domain-containing protein n=2 Tax=Calothrix rhizosoleniae TaxID=888997 RepID=UPI00190E710E|nr:DUF1868 domain-containing protein [Calothrix rhizosoleniae]